MTKCNYCFGHAIARGMCRLHYTRWYKTGIIKTARQYGGSRSLRPDGYVYIWVNGKRKLEHIYLAEKALGKPLPKGARVHHMNDRRDDNFTPFNLVICPNQSYHRLLHKRTKELSCV